MSKPAWKEVDQIYVAHKSNNPAQYGSGYWCRLPELSHVNGAKIQTEIDCGGRLEVVSNRPRDFTVVGLYIVRSGVKFTLKSDDGIFDTVPAESINDFVQAAGIDKGGLIQAKLKWYLNRTQLRLDFA